MLARLDSRQLSAIMFSSRKSSATTKGNQRLKSNNPSLKLNKAKKESKRTKRNSRKSRRRIKASQLGLRRLKSPKSKSKSSDKIKLNKFYFMRKMVQL